MFNILRLSTNLNLGSIFLLLLCVPVHSIATNYRFNAGASGDTEWAGQTITASDTLFIVNSGSTFGINNDSSITSGTSGIVGTTISNTATVNSPNSIQNTGQLTINAAVTGNAEFTNIGTTIIGVSGSMGTTGTFINSGILTIGNSTPFNSSVTLNLGGNGSMNASAALGDIPNNFVLNRPFTMNGSNSFNFSVSSVGSLGANNLTIANTAGTIRLKGNITGTGGIIVDNGPGGTLMLSDNNKTYSGTTQLNSGTLELRIPITNSNVEFTNSGTATLLVSSSTTIGSLSGGTSSSQNISLSSGLNINQTVSGAYGGIITGSGALSKSGAATLTLTGNSSSYSSDVIVFEGALAVGHVNAIGIGGTLFLDGGQLQASQPIGNIIRYRYNQRYY